MSSAGDEVRLARWREAGDWWACAPQLEVCRYLDGQGIRREKIETLPPLMTVDRAETPPRILKLRDEKIARACGYKDPVVAPHVESGGSDSYAALHVLSGYAFGRGGMLAAEICSFPEAWEYQAILLADPFSLMGAREFRRYAAQAEIKPLIGATVEMPEGGELVLVARSKRGYRSLSRLITECHLGEPRLYPLCTWERLERHTEDLLCLTGGDAGVLNRLMVRRDEEGARIMLDHLIGLYGRENVFIQIERSYLPWEIATNERMLELAEYARVTPVAGGPITHHRPENFPAQDVLVCIDTLCTIEEVVGRKPLREEGQPQIPHSPRRALNAERYLRTRSEMRELFRDRPDLLENTLRVAERCDSNVLPGRTNLPKYCENEAELLRYETYEGARHFCKVIDSDVTDRLEMELDRIIRNGFASHFLIAWDMCRWATDQGIVLSGRGSVIDSLVAYCLGFSRINALEHDLHFDRFLPEGATKRPDIDIDFEARRREDVRGYLTTKYGPAHVATVAAFGAYGSRGIIREVGKVMGVPPESLSLLAKRLHGGVTPERLEEALDARPELRNSNIPRERFHWVFRLAEDLMDIPRNARAHSSGVVICEDPIADIVPMMHSGVDGVPIIQWDKRSAKDCFDKFDVLCLRGNDVLSDTQARVRDQVPDFDIRDVSLEDEDVYRAFRAGNLIGIPQSASPAMRQAHIRVRTENLKDAGVVQAAIRPGVGGAVKINEYIARRRGQHYGVLDPLFDDILGSTYGIVVFQEQVDQLLQEFGGYSAAEAEEAREGIYKRKKEEFAQQIRQQVFDRIVARGHSEEIAQEVFQYVAQFEGYGFAQGHALAFADISVRCVWCQQNFPAEYFAALLNAQPAGYYGPATIANEARIREIEILRPDVNRSAINFTPEDLLSEDDPRMLIPHGGIRVGLRQVGGVQEATRERIIAARHDGAFASFFDFVARVRPDRDELERLILCGAFEGLTENRRTLLWAIPRALEYAAMVSSMDGALPLRLQEPPFPEDVEDFSIAERAIQDRRVLDLDIRHHLVAFERARIKEKGGITSAEASRLTPGTKAFVVGNPIRLRFPPTSSGKRVMFFDLEDESGLLNVTCFDDVYQRDGHQVICNPYITLRGEAQDRDGHIAFLAHRIYPYTPCLREIQVTDDPLPIVVSDFLVG
ncbi:DNA polymerase III subunit alpha [Fimbriimonas ginsengisoli]|uniref:DNA-directed DNA polymerase n=1 Tax=Fimbriimonas ginsengisoli Gsoil 348 TaxID=661478 RepID=A0A068NLI7_FIMGI|nr:DNA polymerase III subunit alpha [Fimbriimonas ginsengisoli]AIE84346.1 DNA polymerase III, alpha subunit [Fimbriimonas ginsengisoli Gsoil 348]